MRSGTIKTLAALVACMTLGAALLLAMETAPARPAVPLPLQSTASLPQMEAVRQVDEQVGLQYVKWRHIVIHDTGRDGLAAADGCHFLIGSPRRLGDGQVKATPLWNRQADGRHIDVPGANFNTNSIGICLLLEGQEPTPQQVLALANLVRALQTVCQIPPDRVYLHSDLAQEGCPGPSFPAEAFHQSLLPSN
jgi:hypothetical protein